MNSYKNKCPTIITGRTDSNNDILTISKSYLDYIFLYNNICSADSQSIVLISGIADHFVVDTSCNLICNESRRAEQSNSNKFVIN